jgi:manganese/zinc/iron transport system substrate-binding protein
MKFLIPTRFLAIGLLLLLGALAPQAGCDRDSGDGATTAPARVRVVATTTMVGDLVRQVAADRVELDVLMPAGVDPHSFKPSTADMGRVARADLVLYNGLHLEGKMVDVLEQRLADKAVAVTRDLPRDRLLPWAEGESGAYDPHAWFEPALWSLAAATVASELGRIDPENRWFYNERLSTVQAELAALDGELRARLASLPEARRVLITSHDAFNYFGRAYGVDVRGLQGISTETQAGLSNIKAAVDFIVERGIPAIFVESSVPHGTIERVRDDARSRGVEVSIGGELYSDAMGAPGERPGFDVDTYAGMMRYNVDVFVKAMGGNAQ